MNYKNILTYLIIGIFIFLIGYLNGIVGILEFILSLSIYTLLFFLLHLLFAKIRKKKNMTFYEFINYFLQRVNIFLIFLIVFIGGLSYISNEIYPAPMPEYTITNGKKIIKFQAMSHIGTQSFYDNVAKNLKNYKKEGGVYFYEGVKPGKKENLEKFNKAIGIKFDNDLYKNFSKLYGVTNQNNDDFLGLENNLDFNIDISIDEIVKLYEEKINKKNTTLEFKNKIPIDANEAILKTLSELNEKQLKILVYINQAILNFIIGSENTQNFLTDNFANKDLFDVILGERNKVIANAIIKSEYNKIYMTYGLLHFKGVLELLQKNDPKWKIIYSKNLYPIKN